MAKFKIIVGNPETGKSQSLEIESARAVPLIGRKLGEVIDGSVVGMGGHKLQITGGSDKDGFPMRPNVHGGVRVGVVLSEGVGFHPSRKGERRRKTLRGNVITEEIVQINMKIIEKPKKAKKEQAKRAKKTSEEKGGKTTEEAAETT
jgi:small subunit ribosomal protein S6e